MKEQEKMLQANSTELNDEEIAMISGGGESAVKNPKPGQKKDGSAVTIFYFIEIGDDPRAKRFFRNEKNDLTESEIRKIRKAFYEKFGYEIE